MKVLVIGGGGREHAIVHTLKKSPKVDHIWCAPGNGGIAQEAECVDIKATDIDGVVAFAKEHKPDLVMVAPDDPLALGMVDALEDAGIRAFGPRKNAAIIEGSKSFAKELMKNTTSRPRPMRCSRIPRRRSSTLSSRARRSSSRRTAWRSARA